MKLPFDDPNAKEAFEAIVTRVLPESDRGAALVAGELISEQLLRTLKGYFPTDIPKTLREDLTDGTGALATFSSRIAISYALRLITREVRSAADLLRRVRNDAAHVTKRFNLRDHSDRLREVYNQLGGVAGYETLGENWIITLLWSSQDPDFIEHLDNTNWENLQKHPAIQKALPRYTLAAATANLAVLLTYLRSKTPSFDDSSLIYKYFT